MNGKNALTKRSVLIIMEKYRRNLVVRMKTCLRGIHCY